MGPRDKSIIAILMVGFIPSISVIFGLEIIDDEQSSQLFFLFWKL